MVDKDLPLIFTHMPKTGGMSMFASLSEYYGSRIADMYNISAYEAKQAPAEDFLKDPSMCIYAGHFPFGLHEWLARPSCYMAMVRNPVDRLVSLYQYSIQYRLHIRNMRETTGKSYKEVFADKDAADFYRDFLPWVKAPETFSGFLSSNSPEIDNGMVRRFSGYGLNPEPCPKEALEQAKDNIDQYYSVVGLLEQYAETVGMLRSAFGWNLTEFHINKSTEQSRKSTKLKSDARKRIKAKNPLDIALYDWLVKRFEKTSQSDATPIKVAGQNRTDYENVPLWHAIGSSPIRKSVMENSPEKHRS